MALRAETLEAEMKKRLLVVLSFALLATVTATIPSAAWSSDTPKLDPMGLGVSLLSAFPEPLSLESSGFFQVKPQEFDPGHTDLVEAAWLNAIGCPTNATIAIPNATFTGVGSFGTYTDPACTTGDPKDLRNEGLLLVKTGPTVTNFASAVAELNKVRGTVLTELGYDIRKFGPAASALGSHCGAGAPRFNVTTTDGFFGIGCNSPPPDMQTLGDGWLRLRWGGAVPLMGFQNFVMLAPVTGEVRRIQIVFDEGQDASGGPDRFGGAILDNIDVNGALVGHGATEGD
jgi:hypothetical protein